MSDLIALSDAQFTVNGDVIPIRPNTLAFTEGFGESLVRAASAGAEAVVQVLANDVSGRFSMLRVEIDPDADLIAQFREIKRTPGQHVLTVTASGTIGTVTKQLVRTFPKASLVNDYDVNLGADVAIPLEFKSNPAR